MLVGLKSGKTFECENESYIDSNAYDGDCTHTFISLTERKKYIVNADVIEFLEVDLTDEDIEDLAGYCAQCGDDPDPAVG